MTMEKEQDLCRAILFVNWFLRGECPMQTCDIDVWMGNFCFGQAFPQAITGYRPGGFATA